MRVISLVPNGKTAILRFFLEEGFLEDREDKESTASCSNYRDSGEVKQAYSDW